MTPFDLTSYICGYQSGKHKAENADKSDQGDQEQQPGQDTGNDAKQAENTPEDA